VHGSPDHHLEQGVVLPALHIETTDCRLRTAPEPDEFEAFLHRRFR
jgi:hypothetical protein